MKKRLVCLFLCLVMVLSMVLTSCSEKTEEQATEDIKDAASETAMTLSMWVVCEEKVSADNAAAVSKAINAITNSKFKTKLVINFLTEDEYEGKLKTAIENFEKSNANTQPEEELPEDVEGTDAVETEPVTDATETNDLGMTVIKYPDLLKDQVDIVYIAGEDMYLEFIEKGWLSALDTELTVSSGKKLKEYVSGTLLSAAKVGGKTYAIPNNRTIGEYKYMLLNKELMQKYSQQAYWEQGMIDGFYDDDLHSFLNLVYMFEKDVIPVDSTYDDCLSLLAHYWYIDSEDLSLDLDKFSVFGYHYDNLEELSRGSVALGFESLFANEDFANSFLKLNEFRLKDYFRQSNDQRPVSAVKFTTGDATILAEGEYVIDGVEYYPVVVGYPTATSEDIYGNMFGVCSYTRSVSRSMKIISYLNTNPEFRNLLQYGVENIHYTLSEANDGSLILQRNPKEQFKYMMDIYATGNAFIAYPDPAKNMSADIWESGKVQNRSSLVDPLLGFDFAANLGEDDGEEAFELDMSGYNISYSTGYSKSILNQNSDLKSWLSECDAKGKGIYLFKTQEVDGVYQRNVYYIYNNNVANSVSLMVDKTAIVEEKENNKGELVEEQIGMQLHMLFTNSSTASDTKGYEISVLEVDARKSSTIELDYSFDEGALTAFTNVKEKTGRIDFDFMNTNRYSIEIYNLMRTEVINNQTLISWVLSNHQNTEAMNKNHLMTCERDLGNGKKEVVIVVLRARFANWTALTVQPTGTTDKLIVNFNYDVDPTTPIEDDEVDYIFTYVTVIADSDVRVEAAVSENGRAQKFDTSVTKDVKYERKGSLDTELLKFMQRVNDVLPKAIENAYAKIEKAYDEALAKATTAAEKNAAWSTANKDLKTLISQISLLLSVDDDVPVWTRSNFSLIYNDIKEFAVDDRNTKLPVETLDQFHYNVRALASYETVEYSVSTPDGTFDPYGLYGLADTNPRTEAFVYRDSPFKIYYEWMKKYGYLPQSMQQTEEPTTDGETTTEGEATTT